MLIIRAMAHAFVRALSQRSAGKFLQQDVSVFAGTMEVNYMGTVKVLKAALPGMVARGRGLVVVVSSVMAIIGDARLRRRQRRLLLLP